MGSILNLIIISSLLLTGCVFQKETKLTNLGDKPKKTEAMSLTDTPDGLKTSHKQSTLELKEVSIIKDNTLNEASHDKTNDETKSKRIKSDLTINHRNLTSQEDPLKAINPLTNKTSINSPNKVKHHNMLEVGSVVVQQEQTNETERDLMEEALVLLNESHEEWVKGNLEDAIDLLDQAYALIIDTNGNADIARQKDDLRLMISKRILSIYNSLQSNTSGKRSEIPIVINSDVEKEIRQFQTIEREFFISSYQRSALYRPIILNELKKAGLPEELVWLPLVESGFKINALSSARALGLWQFIPSTGYKYGLNRDEWIDERMDIEKSTRAAIDYLKELHGMFGDWLTVLAAYNCGEGRVIRTIASQHINYLDRFWDLYRKLPYETARYVPRFLATLLIIKNPNHYGIDLGESNIAALNYETIEINKSVRLHDIAKEANVSEEMLNILNAELRHKITPNRPYKLKVPSESMELVMKAINDIPEADIKNVITLKKGSVIKHKVRAGETINSIAKKYKVPVSLLVEYNRLKKRRLTVGQKINIPVRSSNVIQSISNKSKDVKSSIKKYKVQQGDTLISIAKKYGTNTSTLKAINNLHNEKLKVGQIIKVESLNDDFSSAAGSKREGEAQGGEKITSKDKKGQSLKSVRKYIVKAGDNLTSIARENNVELAKLLTINKLNTRAVIRPGQELILP